VHRELVREHLGGVPVVGEAVPDRDAGQLGEHLDVLLLAAAELDAVVEAAQHPGGVRDRLLVAHLRPARVEVGDVRALVERGDLERTPRAGRGLLEDQGDVLLREVVDLAALLLGGLQFGRQVEQVPPLLGSEVQLLQEAAALQVDAHVCPFENGVVVGCGLVVKVRCLRGAWGSSCTGGRRGRGRARRSAR